MPPLLIICLWMCTECKYGAYECSKIHVSSILLKFKFMYIFSIFICKFDNVQSLQYCSDILCKLEDDETRRRGCKCFKCCQKNVKLDDDGTRTRT